MRLLAILTLLALGGACWDQSASEAPSHLRVVAGAEVGEGDQELASTVALSVIDDFSSGPVGDVFCSGTLIHERWVLTAAHCVEGFLNWQPVEPVLAIEDDFTPEAWDIVQNDPTCLDKMNQAYNTPPPKNFYLSFGKQVQIDEEKRLLNPNLDYIEIPADSLHVFVHPDYVGDLFASPLERAKSVDLALIRIPQEHLPVSAKTAPPLSTAEFNTMLRGNVPPLTVAGYGSMGTVMKLYDKPKTCEHIISMGLEFEHKAIGTLRKRSVQFIKENGGNFIASTGACKGDSGGPAYLAKNGSLFLVGTVSAEYIEGEGNPFSNVRVPIEVIEQCTQTDTEYVAVAWQQQWLSQTMRNADGDAATAGNGDRSDPVCSIANLSGDPYVNVRSGPGRQHGVVDRMTLGSHVTLAGQERGDEVFDSALGKTSSWWGKINIDTNEQGYVSMLYLQCR